MPSHAIVASPTSSSPFSRLMTNSSCARSASLGVGGAEHDAVVLASPSVMSCLMSNSKALTLSPLPPPSCFTGSHTMAVSNTMALSIDSISASATCMAKNRDSDASTTGFGGYMGDRNQYMIAHGKIKILNMIINDLKNL